MTNIDAQRIKEIRNNTKEMTYYMKSIAKSFERIADALESATNTLQTGKNCDNCGTKTELCYYCDSGHNMWTPQTNRTKPTECNCCTKHICYGCEHRAKKEAWRKAQTDCGWK